jgi:xanthine dehydrogenase YagR molybdenum-binding subunit
LARLIRTEKEVEGRYEDVWIVVDEDALDQWPAGPLTTVGREVPRVDGLDRARGKAPSCSCPGCCTRPFCAALTRARV